MDQHWWEHESLLPFKKQSSIGVVGGTGSGKTYWTFKLLKNLNGMFEGEPPHTVLYCYGCYQPLFELMEKDIPNLTMHEGLPTRDMLDAVASNGKHNLIIIDDLMEVFLGDQNMQDLLTKLCHHKNFSVVYLLQNLYQGGKNARTMSLNTWYLVLFKNLRDASQIITLARQMYPGQGSILKKAYEDATSGDYGYLVIDSSPNARQEYRLRTNIFPNQDCQVYIPKV